MTACGSCHAEIIWALTTTGRRMPLDPDPHPGGTIALVEEERGQVAHVTGPAPGAVRYRSHFATCPNAGSHRKAAKPDPARPTLF